MLGANIRRSQLQDKLLEDKDDILFSRLLLEPSPPAPEGEAELKMKKTFSQRDDAMVTTSIPWKKTHTCFGFVELNTSRGCRGVNHQKQPNSDSAEAKRQDR